MSQPPLVPGNPEYQPRLSDLMPPSPPPGPPDYTKYNRESWRQAIIGIVLCAVVMLAGALFILLSATGYLPGW